MSISPEVYAAAIDAIFHVDAARMVRAFSRNS